MTDRRDDQSPTDQPPPHPGRGRNADRRVVGGRVTHLRRRAALVAVILLAATIALAVALDTMHTSTSTDHHTGSAASNASATNSPSPNDATDSNTDVDPDTNASSNPESTATSTTAVPAATAGNPPPPDTPLGVSPPATAATVAVLHLDLVDHSRPTVSKGHELSASRSLPTTVYLPARADGTPAGQRLPLVIFVHGFAVAPPTYDALLRTWARHGYVVAAPTLPLTSSASGANTDEHDLVNEPADVSFLITTLIDRAAGGDTSGGPLTDRIDPDRVAVAGHSDGADVAFLTGFGSTQRDPRVTAVIDLSGDLLTWTGPFTSTASSPPFLQIVSDADRYVSIRQAAELYDSVCCHKSWVLLHGPEHLQPFTSPASPWTPIVDAVTVAFLDRYVGRFAVPDGQLAAAADHPPLAELRASNP